jgi:hypothetical protein
VVLALAIFSATVSAAAMLIVVSLTAWVVTLAFRASRTVDSQKRPKDL